MTIWDTRYDGDGYVYGTEPNDFVRQQAAVIPPGRVLDLAAGEGRNAVYLATLGYDVTAVDSSVVGLAKAQHLAALHGVPLTTTVADLHDYVLGTAQWQGITAIFCHLPSALRHSVCQRVVAGLAPGGVLLLESYTPQQLRYGTGGPPDADLMPTLAELQTLLAPLTFEVGHEIEREVYEGRGHHGLSAVVQVLARKPTT